MSRLNRTCSAAALAVLAGLAQAGPLNPPAGPVTSTMKTLTDVEPRIALSAANTPGDGDSMFRITVPGSYYLTGHLPAFAGYHGIEIAADNVTIDLNGYTIQGVASSKAGIGIPGVTRTNITIKNGSITGCGSDGIDLRTSNISHIQSITSTGNNGVGIAASNQALVEDCIASANTSTGFLVGGTSVVSRCSAKGNGTAGSHPGIRAGDRTEVISCATSSNTGSGIDVGQGCRVVDCTSAFNSNGIQAYYRGTITGCVCQHNTFDGIVVGDGAIVSGNNCTDNGDDGIQVDDLCTVTRNSCMSNGPSAAGSGVFVVGDACKIDDNQFTSNAYGVLVSSLRVNNFIVRNTATGNVLNFSVPANNDFAPVISNPGTTFTGATPWSNFAY